MALVTIPNTVTPLMSFSIKARKVLGDSRYLLTVLPRTGCLACPATQTTDLITPEMFLGASLAYLQNSAL